MRLLFYKRHFLREIPCYGVANLIMPELTIHLPYTCICLLALGTSDQCAKLVEKRNIT